jgi:hypothetical protein
MTYLCRIYLIYVWPRRAATKGRTRCARGWGRNRATGAWSLGEKRRCQPHGLGESLSAREQPVVAQKQGWWGRRGTVTGRAGKGREGKGQADKGLACTR